MKIPTIKRRKWHHQEANFQATDSDGRRWAFEAKPIASLGNGFWYSRGPFRDFMGPPGRSPKDWTTTLRRIAPARKGSK